MMNPLQSATLFFSGHLPEPDKTSRLCQFAMEALLDCVAANDPQGVRDLLGSEENLGWILAGFKRPDYTPVHHAAAQGRAYALQALMERLPLELSCLPTPDLQRTPLMLAAEYGHADVLIKYRLGVLEKDREERLADQATLMAYATKMVKSRLGLDGARPAWEARWASVVNARDVYGNTALLLALKRGHYFCARILLTMQADPCCENDRGQSGLQLIREIPADSLHRPLLLGGLKSQIAAGTLDATRV